MPSSQPDSITPVSETPDAGTPWRVDVHSPDSGCATAFVEDARTGEVTATPMHRDGARWSADLLACDGDLYWLEVDGIGPLVDPSASDVVMTDDGPRGVVRRRWPEGRRCPVPLRSNPVIYEMHVDAFGLTFRGIVDRLSYLADLGIDVIELMPIHPFDSRSNYWGYMPIVWGAVHREYAEEPDDAPAELATLVQAAHEVGIAVWLDVVVNHTGEGDATMPTWTLRGLDDQHAYRRSADGSYIDDAGCGNVVDPSDGEIRRLVMEALQRFAALGIDGFRFDLASLLTRDGGEFVRTIGDWAAAEGITLVAEAWDLATYQVGGGFPDPRWMQWNDRFRDDGRGFLRAEPGLVPSIANRIAGSPDLFGKTTWRSVNFLTAHDGLTLHDLTAVTSDRHRSWDAGPELRLQQMKNGFALLLLSVGGAMFVMGDEFARTQHGHDNPYDIDNELTWVDWRRLTEWGELHSFVRRLISLRRTHVAGMPQFAGPRDALDPDALSRALAWTFGGGGGEEDDSSPPLRVVANLSWDPVTFAFDDGVQWQVVLRTDGDTSGEAGGAEWSVPARTILVLGMADASR